jgi:L-2-hydroxyglutarate oxidase
LEYGVAIIGGGVLGTSIAYFLSGNAKDPGSIALIEQQSAVASHTSGRNTGKVHAPFLYDPEKKKLFAKAASMGFDMWEKFALAKNLAFRRDGVMEVATTDPEIGRLQKYMAWGERNGLTKEELKFLDKGEAKMAEPNVKCEAAILCTKDGSVDYNAFTQALLHDARSFGCTVLLDSRVRGISYSNGLHRIKTQDREVSARFIVNAAGGNAIDIAHAMGVAPDYTDLHFRGEYWQAPAQYNDLTKLSIYSVPKHPEYPFLDPHWIVRADGRREVGPNAVPVFGPYAYTMGKNLADMMPKIFESAGTGARKAFFDRQFLSLAGSEIKSSLSKTAMINRVRAFLPAIRPSAFTKRGTAGIRSSVIDRSGKFVPDTLVQEGESSLHVINYNSPGATGALPVAAKISASLAGRGIVDNAGRAVMTMWDPADVAAEMGDNF